MKIPMNSNSIKCNSIQVAKHLLPGLVIVGLYHSAVVLPKMQELEHLHQTIATVDVTGMIRDKAKELSFNDKSTLNSQTANQVVALEHYGEELRDTILQFATENNAIILPKEAVVSRVDDVTPFIKQIQAQKQK